MRVSVIGDDVTWTVFINKTCTDTFYHWTSDTELTICVMYVRVFHFKYLCKLLLYHYCITATKVHYYY